MMEQIALVGVAYVVGVLARAEYLRRTCRKSCAGCKAAWACERDVEIA